MAGDTQPVTLDAEAVVQQLLALRASGMAVVAQSSALLAQMGHTAGAHAAPVADSPQDVLGLERPVFGQAMAQRVEGSGP